MEVTSAVPFAGDDTLYVRIAREIAMDLHPLDTILSRLRVSTSRWQSIQKHPRFISILRSEIEAWGSAGNTSERVKVKSAALLEEWLPELYSRLNDRGESLHAKIEGGKLAASLAGLGKTAVNMQGAQERLSVTINLGADQRIKIEKDITPPVIDAEAVSE